MSNRVPPATSRQIFDELSLAKCEISNMVAAEVGYLGSPRLEHIKMADLMIEARMVALEANPNLKKPTTPIDKAVQRFIDLNREYAAAAEIA